MKIGKGRLATCVALAALIGVVAASSANAGLFGLWGSKSKKAKEARVVRHSLAIFPFDSDAIVNAPESFGDYVASDVRSMLAPNPHYQAFLFRDRLAPVERAITETDSGIKADDVKAPYSDDKAKTLKLARLLAVDYYIVGAVDGYEVDASKKVAQITLRADLYDAKTGKLVRTLLVTGSTPEAEKSSDADELRDIAKGAVVTKLVAELASGPVAEQPAPAVIDASPEKAAEKPVEASKANAAK